MSSLEAQGKETISGDEVIQEEPTNAQVFEYALRAMRDDAKYKRPSRAPVDYLNNLRDTMKKENENDPNLLVIDKLIEEYENE